MENKELAEQLRIAAEILETGKEWEWRYLHGPQWHSYRTITLKEAIQKELVIRIKPWSLPAPPEGEKWINAKTWHQGMLCVGERPLLEGEKIKNGDLYYYQGGWLIWSDGSTVDNDKMPIKTLRPLPHKKTNKIVPLEPEDVPMGSYLRHKTAPECSWRSVIGLSKNGAASMEMNSNNVISMKFCSWEELKELYLIKRPTDADFVPAHKEIEE